MAYPGYGAPPPGGYGGGYLGFPGGYPAGGMQQDPLYRNFLALAGADQQIDANKLQGYLSSSGFFGSCYPFSFETGRLMIAMLNRDFSGKIGFNEFKGLLILLNQWKDQKIDATILEGFLGSCCPISLETCRLLLWSVAGLTNREL
ncbi:sorcin-like [Porites lutea]|uniref:sorcin-like n=1 Tax=Porites lutea TaxID=51062 RepID=UPI003CC559B2